MYSSSDVLVSDSAVISLFLFFSSPRIFLILLHFCEGKTPYCGAVIGGATFVLNTTPTPILYI